MGTFVNAEGVTVCTMCLSERPNAASLDKHLSTKSEQTWSCQSCGYHNTRTQMCRMCGYVLGNEITPQNDGKSDDEQKSEAKNGNLNLDKMNLQANEIVNAKSGGTMSPNGAMSP